MSGSRSRSPLVGGGAFVLWEAVPHRLGETDTGGLLECGLDGRNVKKISTVSRKTPPCRRPCALA